MMNVPEADNILPQNLVFFGAGKGSFVGVINRRVSVPDGERGLEFMRDFLRKNCRKKSPGDPPFSAGFVGFLSYDLGAKWQGVSRRVKDDTSCPVAHFVYVDKVFPAGEIFNCHRSRECGGHIVPKSNLSYKKYAQKIAKIKKHLFDGDTYQVNFSQRFSFPYRDNAFDIYKKITKLNPSPFQFFMESKKFAVISNSPERLFKITTANNGDKIIETCPIKGTMPRGKTKAQDDGNIKKLLSNAKERAELSMIVDLERNDLGKICEPGTVEVGAHRRIEKYSHVIHTVSDIRGILCEKYDWLDALHALFPGGSITGCPKRRTMEIIDELEDFQRGVYCGSAGYIDLSGDCDFNIMIRTIWVDKKGGRAIFHSGGGIVVDSDAKKEYEETLHKAAAIIGAL